jgi:hypothetical protein
VFRKIYEAMEFLSTPIHILMNPKIKKIDDERYQRLCDIIDTFDVYINDKSCENKIKLKRTLRKNAEFMKTKRRI